MIYNNLMKHQVLSEEIVSPPESFLYQNKPTNNQNPGISTLKGLFMKSITLQSRHYCSNICQIITPIICLLFTLAVRQIVANLTTSAVKTFQFPQPYNLPIVNSVVRSQAGLSCDEIYYYEDKNNIKWVQNILKMQLKQACPSNINPQFIRKQSVNKAIMQCLNQANKLDFERGDDLKTQIPDGFVEFKQAKRNDLSARIGINDFRLPEYHKNNGVTKIMVKTSSTTTISTYLRVTQGMMSLIDKITRPYLQLINPKQIISGSFMYMPFSGEDKSFMNKAINVMGSGLYPLGLSLLLPLFLYLLVSEKEERQVEIMKMNGLNMKYYWINFFIVSFLMSIFTSLVMYLVAIFIIDITFFTQTSALVVWIVFIVWAIAQTSMTSFVQVFIDNSKTATIVGYVLSIFSTLVGIAISTVIFPYPFTLPFYLMIYPPFALNRIVYHLGLACADSRECYKSFVDLDGQAILCIFILFCWIFVFLFSIWLNEVVQQEYGVAKRPEIVEKILGFFKRRAKKEVLIAQLDEQGSNVDGPSYQMKDVESYYLNQVDEIIDDSVKKIAQEINCQRFNDSPLLIKGLSKCYATDNGQKNKIALKPLTMKLIKGQIFGFLGPNGAGKTTLISVLTGMYPQTSGNAWISKREIGHYETNKLIGVCPQFDILWRDLTIQQHLIFYCRLKNIPQNDIFEKVKESLQDVDLLTSKDLKAQELSGGMQRRLSIAIALVGNPAVIFLDEPSSGLDPFHRRQIWDILAKCKKKTSIFLTSHLMQEVQYLCDRIGIINLGQLKCIDKIKSLKQRYGKGYTLTLSYHNLLREKRPQIVQDVLQKFKVEVDNELETRITLKIDKKQIAKCASFLKNQVEVEWSINQPTLYDVFSHFVR